MVLQRVWRHAAMLRVVASGVSWCFVAVVVGGFVVIVAAVVAVVAALFFVVFVESL